MTEQELQLLIEYGIDLRARKLSIIGDIDTNTLIRVDSALSILENDTEGLIEIHIHSDGGDVNAALGIADAIKRSNCSIRTYNMQSCFSAAVLVFAAGDIRASNPFARFMVHEISSEPPNDKTSNLKKTVREMESLELIYCTALENFTGTSEKEWMALLKRKTDYYFGINEAKELNLITEEI